MPNSNLRAQSLDEMLGISERSAADVKEERLVGIVKDYQVGIVTRYAVLRPPITSAAAQALAETIKGWLVKIEPYTEIGTDSGADKQVLIDTFDQAEGLPYKLKLDPEVTEDMTIRDYDRLIRIQAAGSIPDAA